MHWIRDDGGVKRVLLSAGVMKLSWWWSWLVRVEFFLYVDLVGNRHFLVRVTLYGAPR